MSAFNDVIQDFSLFEIPTIGPFMTWMCGRGVGKVFERLDREIANSDFFNSISRNIFYEHITKENSNHLPILFRFGGVSNDTTIRTKLFRFENLWLSNDSRANVVEKGWDIPSKHKMIGLGKGINSCRLALDDWNRTTFESILWAIRDKQRRIKHLLCNDDLSDAIPELDECQQQLRMLHAQEETL